MYIEMIVLSCWNKHKFRFDNKCKFCTDGGANIFASKRANIQLNLKTFLDGTSPEHQLVGFALISM